MKLALPFKRQREQKALTLSGGVVAAIQDGWSPIPALGGGATQRILDAFNTAQGSNYSWMYQRSTALRTVIDILVRNIGQLPLRLYEELSESERKPRPDHPAALSLRYPNEFTAGDKFIRELFVDHLIHDNAYALLTQAVTDGPVRFEHLPAYMVQVQSRTLFRTENYRIWNQGAWTGQGAWGGSGDPVDLDPASVLHWHGENPTDPRVGLSKLDSLRDVIAEDAALTQAIVELANNNMQAPIYATRPLEAPDIKATTARAHEQDLTNKVRRRNQLIPLLMEGEDLHSFGVSPQDAQMLEVRRWCLLRVAAAFGLGPEDVGLASPTPDSTARFYSDVLPPLCQNFTRMLNQRVLVEVFDWQAGTFEFDMDAKTGWSQLPNLISATGRPIMTTNEGRAKLNLPPQKDGDELVTPGNVAVGGKPSVGVMPPQDPNKPAQDGSYRTDQGPTPLPSGAGGQRNDRQSSGQVAAGKAFDPRERRDEHGRWTRNGTGDAVGVRGSDAPSLTEADPRTVRQALGEGYEADYPNRLDLLPAIKANRPIQVFRVTDEGTPIGSGDYVTESREYATSMRAARGGKIAAAEVTPSRLSITVSGGLVVPHEFFYQSAKAAREMEQKRRTAMYTFPSYQSRRHRAKVRQDRNVARFEKTVGNYLTGLEPKLRAVKATKSRKAVADWEHWTADFARLLFRAIREVIAAEGAGTAAQLGSAFSLDETKNYRTAMANGSAQSILDKIRQEIETHGVDWALARLPQHAASAGGSLGARATVWARQEAARQSGQSNLQETWVKDTERHAHLDGKSVPLGGTWEGGLRPGNSPGCRCTSVVT